MFQCYTSAMFDIDSRSPQNYCNETCQNIAFNIRHSGQLNIKPACV